MADENDAPIEVDPFEEIKSKIKDLKEGLMEIATQLGRLKGELKAHKEEADAHNPGTIAKRKLN